MADGPLQESLQALTRFLVGDSTVAQTLQRIVDVSAAAVPPAAYTGISMLVEDKVTTSVFSDPDVPEIDQAQYDSGHGPCVDAYRDRVVYEVPSTAHDTRWPEFSQAALEHGIGSSLSLPLVAGEMSLGALNFYARDEAAFSDDDREAGQAFATQAAVVLANAQAYWDAHALSEQLTEAMQSRATIEQAKGILMAQSGVDADTAFAMLRSASQRENRKLRDVAHELVARYSQSRPTGPPGRHHEHPG
jgi:GAF domain-containing protein